MKCDENYEKSHPQISNEVRKSCPKACTGNNLQNKISYYNENMI